MHARIRRHVRQQTCKRPTSVLDEVANRPLVEVVIGRLLLQLRVDPLRIFIGPIRQQDDVLSIRLDGIVAVRLDDERAIDAPLFLESGMAVIPERARLAHLEAVGVGLSGTDAVKAQAWHAIHVSRQDDAVPVDRGVLVPEPVGDAHRDRIALAPSHHRSWDRAIDGERGSSDAREVHRRFTDGQIERSAPEFRWQWARGGLRKRAPVTERGERASGGKSFDKRTA